MIQAKIIHGWSHVKCNYSSRHLLKKYISSLLITPELDIKNKRYIKYAIETCVHCGVSKATLC